ncbi:MAG: flagellar motor protein MotA [Rhodospirillaceae bacterium]|nr:flagellar motor protein MotA [Rhodospirillaceae bacterium]
MSRPRRYLTLMALGIAGVLLLVIVLFPRIRDAYLHNPGLNTGILAVMLIGIAFIFWQVLRLYPEVEWVERFRRGDPSAASEPPRLLAPLAVMIGERQGRLSMSPVAMRSLLDGINARLSESHDISRYLIGLLIFLGLLGTFWGLLGTIHAVADAIAAISTGGTDSVTFFSALKEQLQQPLQGMGTAFSASLFGLSGSLVLGFLELQAGQAHTRFFNELEDWLAAQTRLASASLAADEQSVPAYIQALLEQTADSLDNLQRTIARSEESRLQADQNLKALTDRLSLITEQRRSEQQLIAKIAENQAELRPWLNRIADMAAQGSFGIDEATRHHLRNIDLQLGRLVEDTVQGREFVVRELRQEFKLLARTIAAVAEGEVVRER